MTGSIPPGGVPFEAAGSAYVLRYSVNALILLEDHFDTDVAGVLKLVEGGATLRTLRTVFWAGLTDCSPGITQEAGGEVMTAVGIEDAPDLITRALIKAFPSAAGAGDGSRPPKAAAKRKPGTGKPASANGAC